MFTINILKAYVIFECLAYNTYFHASKNTFNIIRPVLIMSIPDEDNSRSVSFALRKVEDTKRVTRNRTSNKDRQHNDQKKQVQKDKQ